MQSRTKNNLLASIIIPTYKEAENLLPLISSIAEVMEPRALPYEVIVVDDDSQDGTKEILTELADEGYPVRVITRIGQRGLSSAVIVGFNEARGQILVCMDADMSHPPEAIPLLLGYLEDDEVDFVVGSRYVAGGSTDQKWGLLRWLNSKVATMMAWPFTQVKDPMSGFFALPRKVFDKAGPLSPVGYKIGLELMVKCACKNVREVPIHFSDRRFGQSKLNFKEKINYIKHLKRLADYKYGVFSQFAQFCLVGGTGMVIDLGTYGLLLGLSVPIMLARALAIWVAMTWNFWFNRRLTFSYSRSGSVFVQYPRFVGSCALGAVVSWSVSIGLVRFVEFFSGHLFIAALIGILAGTVCNFVISRQWVFRGQKPKLSINRIDGDETSV